MLGANLGLRLYGEVSVMSYMCEGRVSDCFPRPAAHVCCYNLVDMRCNCDRIPVDYVPKVVYDITVCD